MTQQQPPRYTCPVCEYDRLLAPPRDYYICPQCGTEFGLDDVAVSHKALQQAWIDAGRPWFSRHTPKPTQ